MIVQEKNRLEKVRQFARACGRLSKTDRIDAFVLAEPAEFNKKPDAVCLALILATGR
jgi:hypothetical protein